MVSVIMITYMHEKFIAQAIEGVLMQETNFDFELVIGNDCSPDNTNSIICDFINNHPRGHLINNINRKVNIGMHANYADVLNKSQGKYVAICDGDDFWIDKNKLQLQVNIFEEDPKYSLVYSLSTDVFLDGSNKLTNEDDPDEFDFVYLLNRGWNIRTATIMFRKEYVNLNPWVNIKYSMDYLMQLLAGSKGAIKKLNRNTAIYRHGNGVSKADIDTNIIRRIAFNEDLLMRLDLFTELRFTKEINDKIRKYYSEIVMLAIVNKKIKYLKLISKSDILFLFKLICKKIGNRMK